MPIDDVVLLLLLQRVIDIGDNAFMKLHCLDNIKCGHSRKY